MFPGETDGAGLVFVFFISSSIQATPPPPPVKPDRLLISSKSDFFLFFSSDLTGKKIYDLSTLIAPREAFVCCFREKLSGKQISFFLFSPTASGVASHELTHGRGGGGGGGRFGSEVSFAAKKVCDVARSM